MNQEPSTPAGYRLYAVGDIHGHADLLTRLLAQIEEDALNHPDKKKRLIFLGDYVDRGIQSREVIDRLMQSFAADLEPVFIRGNHDDSFLRFINGDMEIGAGWLRYGGAATLASYGVNPFGGNGHMTALHAEFMKKVPAAHAEFLDSTIFSASYGDYYFVHAGVKPGVPLSKQTSMDKMWARQEFLASTADFGKVIVHGHTIFTQPDVKPNRISIDTGSYATGRITCLILDGKEKAFLST